VAALALKGLSPGAALVFLLAGPVTNLAGLTVVLRILGRAGTAVYFASICVCTLGLGLAANAMYQGLGLDLAGWATMAEHEHVGILSVVWGLALLGVLIWPRLKPGNRLACRS
jgi:hypothetical protein